jgi:hypothetical protein
MNITISKKYKIIIASSVVTVAIAALAFILVLKVITPEKSTNTDNNTIETLKSSAAKSENKGDTSAAIETYEALLLKYKQANDADKIADAEAKINQLETFKQQEEEEARQAAIEKQAEVRDTQE